MITIVIIITVIIIIIVVRYVILNNNNNDSNIVRSENRRDEGAGGGVRIACTYTGCVYRPWPDYDATDRTRPEFGITVVLDIIIYYDRVLAQNGERPTFSRPCKQARIKEGSIAHAGLKNRSF